MSIKILCLILHNQASMMLVLMRLADHAIKKPEADEISDDLNARVQETVDVLKELERK